MALACWKGFVNFHKRMFAVLEEIIFDLSTTFVGFVLLLCSIYTFYLQHFDYINCPDSGEAKDVHRRGRFCFIDGQKTKCNFEDWDSCYASADAIYHWSPILLLLQAFCFYSPKFLVKQLNGNKWEQALFSFYVIKPDMDKEKRKLELYHAYCDFLDRLFGRNYLARLTIVSELVIAVTYAFQVYFITDTFNTKFYEDVYSGNKFDEVFPKTLQCTYPEVGENGTTVYKVEKCEVPLNYANECIYTYQWTIFNIMFGFTALVFLYRLVSFVFYKSNAFNRFEFGRVSRGKVAHDNVFVVADDGYLKWLTLRRLAAVLKADDFNLLLEVLAMEMTAEAMGVNLMEDNFGLMIVEMDLLTAPEIQVAE